MEREQAIEEFLKELKKTINISSLFPQTHPLFIKAAQDFQKFLDALFPILNPITIGVTPDSILAEKRFLGGETGPYGELARHLHMRRIQSIEIRQGVTFDEILTLLSCIATHSKELARAGGIRHLIETTGAGHIAIAELDYTQLLKGTGSECKDIWIYLLRDAVDKEDTEKIDALSQNFGKMLAHFRIKDVVENPEQRENIYKFLKYLKDNGKESYYTCAKDVSGALLRGRDATLADADIDKFKMFFEGLTDDDWADVLSQGLIEENGLDNLSFGLFAKMLDTSRHERVAARTAHALKSRPVADPKKLANSIKKLLTVSEDSTVSKVYQNTLSALLQETAFAKAVQFDRLSLSRNYAFILLNLLFEEKDNEKIVLLVEKVTAGLSDIIRSRDAEYIKNLLQVIRTKREGHPEWSDLFSAPEQMVFTFIERALLEDTLEAPFEEFAKALTKSSLGLDFYLDKIFEEGCVNPVAVALFLRFFPNDLPVFYKHLEKKLADMAFLQRLVDALGAADSMGALEALKYVYVRANNLIKREVIIAMQSLSFYDAEFLLALLPSADISLKKEALVILRKDEDARHRALEALFLIKNPWGFKNKLILENILAVEEVGMKAAAEYLAVLAKRKLIWYWGVAKKAGQVLKKWSR